MYYPVYQNGCSDAAGPPGGETAGPYPGAQPGVGSPQAALAGAPPSNTAPANYIGDGAGLVVLRYGVDSLYLSYPGQLASGWEKRLQGLKLAARSEDERDRANAQVNIGGHLFEVRERGQGRFAYVLADNCYQISLASSRSTNLPVAYVQLSSELITALGYEQAEAELRYIVNTLGLVREEANISRVDLFVDFLSDVSMDSWGPEAWVTRAHRIDRHHVQRRFSGWSIGLGGVMGGRLYDKTLELEKSRKNYLKPLWASRGWDEGQAVWRLEFEFKRGALKELGVLKVSALSDKMGGLWRYACGSWLRLTLPNPEDDNQTRWPNHPLWDALGALDWGDADAPSLARVRRDRIPHDESLFINGLGAITSFMARERITDLGEGFGEFLAHADRYHEHRSRKTGKGFKKYILDKVAEKGKRYNTLNNKPDKQVEAEKRATAEAYRKERDGE